MLYIILTNFAIVVIICSCIFTMQINLEVRYHEEHHPGGAHQPYGHGRWEP